MKKIVIPALLTVGLMMGCTTKYVVVEKPVRTKPRTVYVDRTTVKSAPNVHNSRAESFEAVGSSSNSSY